MVKPVYWISIKIKKHLRVSIEYKNLQNSLRGVFYIWGELHKCPIFYFLFYPYERHSHISLLIEMGFSALAIADRVGHESIDITYRYAHLFPNKQTEMANRLDVERTTDIVLTGNIEEEISVDQIKKDAEEDTGYKG